MGRRSAAAGGLGLRDLKEVVGRDEWMEDKGNKARD